QRIDLDRQLGIKLLHRFLAEVNLLELEAATETGMGNILKQARHFGFLWQLRQQGAKHFLHVIQLLAVLVKVLRLERLVFVLVHQVRFTAGLLLQCLVLRRNLEEIAEENNQNKHQHGSADLDRCRPAAHVLGIEVLKGVDQLLQIKILVQLAHFFAPPALLSAALSCADSCASCVTVSTKELASESATALTVCKLGSWNQGDSF